MVISESHKIVFVAIPKTGTTSVTNVFKRHFGGSRISSHGHIVPVEYKDFFTFAICRNPYDRCVSTWWSTTQRVSDRHNYRKIMGKDLSFDNFCSNFDNLHASWPPLILPQSHWLDQIKINEILSFETLDEQWKGLAFNQELKTVLPYQNPTVRVGAWNKTARENYTKYLTDKSIKLINNYYKRDFGILPQYERLT